MPSPAEAQERLEQALFEIRRVIAGQGARIAVGAVYEPRLGRGEVAALRSEWREALERARTISTP